MTPEQFSRLRALFDKAMALSEDQRSSFVDEQLSVSDPLYAELLAMVATGNNSAFLNAPTVPGSSATTPGDSWPDVQVGNYKVLREIAHGGMGVVYLAVRNDDVFHKIVALKVIRAIGAERSDFVQRFKQERQILAGLEHPNIARILDGGNTSEGRPFSVMEYVDGSPIDEYCTRMAADVATRVRMVATVCEAVEYLHAHAVTHRDIKPGNILVTTDGRVKLVDFGIAKIDTVAGMVPSPSGPGQPTMIMTPGYASPEQLLGAASGKSGDIYSLGIVLYRLLTGRLPYIGQDGLPNLEAQLSSTEPEPPSKQSPTGTSRPLRPTDSRKTSLADLDRVVLKALQLDPARRYTSVQDLGEDLRRCLDGRPIAARSESVTYRFRKFVSRNRVAAALVVLLGIVSGAGGWTLVALRIERVRLEAKENELARFVALMDTRVNRWRDEVPPIPTSERVADVRDANQVMSSESVRSLAASSPDPERVGQLVAELRAVMDRAETLAAGLAPLRKEIALVYRQIGDFQAVATDRRAGDRNQAQVSYKRAATVAASLRHEEPEWARGQLFDLEGRLQTLGLPLEIPPEEAPPQVQVAAHPPDPKPVSRPAAPPPPPTVVAESEVDRARRSELQQSLRAITGEAQGARRNLASLQESLSQSGQGIRSEFLTSIGRVDSLLEDARSALDSRDLAGAETVLSRARYELRRLQQAIGR